MTEGTPADMPQYRSCGFLVWRFARTDDAVAVPRERQFLLMKHPRRWDLPKGHVDQGESDTQCALRELAEETGIQAGDIEIDPDFEFSIEYPVHYSRRPPGWKTAVYFLAQLVARRPIEVTEHAAFQWFDWAPPHDIQAETVNPLLDAVAAHWHHQQPNET